MCSDWLRHLPTRNCFGTPLFVFGLKFFPGEPGAVRRVQDTTSGVEVAELTMARMAAFMGSDRFDHETMTWAN